MKFHQLSTFVAVVDHGSVTAAADALSVSQPAVSQTIRSLERDLGVAVFDRIGRNVRLNAAGEALLPGARQALRDLQIARDAVASVSALRSGRLDLVSLPTLGVSPVAELIGEFTGVIPTSASGSSSRNRRPGSDRWSPAGRPRSGSPS